MQLIPEQAENLAPALRLQVQEPEEVTGPTIYACKACDAPVASSADRESRNFRGIHGRGSLFANVTNVEVGVAQERNMTTGLHLVQDVRCGGCETILGWRYEKAYEAGEQYKEGKCVLEMTLLCEV